MANGDIVRKGLNKLYVEFDNQLYQINGKSGEVFEARQRQFALDGTYGELIQVIAGAQLQNNLPVKLAWSGIKNSMGDFVSVYPPVNPISKE